MKVVIDIKKETYDLIRETIAFWRSDERYTVAPVGWQEIADSEPYDERPKGKWKFISGATTQGSLKCPFCDYRDYHKTNSNFCPNCGAKMKGGAK